MSLRKQGAGISFKQKFSDQIDIYSLKVRDWEQDFYKLNQIINIDPIRLNQYEQALSQMKRNALKIKISYNSHLDFIEERYTIIQQFKLLKTAQIKVQEDFQKNKCKN